MSTNNTNESWPYDYYSEGTDYDRIYFLEEQLKILQDDINQLKRIIMKINPTLQQKTCDCGAEKSNTTHSSWCSLNTAS